MKRTFVMILLAIAVIVCGGCTSGAHKVILEVNDDFAGLVVIKGKPGVAKPFSGTVVVPTSGEVDVSERSFYGDFVIHATRRDGAPLKVELLSGDAAPDDYAAWWLPDGAYVRYFFVGRRDELIRFYHANKDRLYQVDESRLKRVGNSFELKTETQ